MKHINIILSDSVNTLSEIKKAFFALDDSVKDEAFSELQEEVKRYNDFQKLANIRKHYSASQVLDNDTTFCGSAFAVVCEPFDSSVKERQKAIERAEIYTFLSVKRETDDIVFEISSKTANFRAVPTFYKEQYKTATKTPKKEEIEKELFGEALEIVRLFIDCVHSTHRVNDDTFTVNAGCALVESLRYAQNITGKDDCENPFLTEKTEYSNAKKALQAKILFRALTGDCDYDKKVNHYHWNYLALACMKLRKGITYASPLDIIQDIIDCGRFAYNGIAIPEINKNAPQHKSDIVII